ncbi:hypothetical protein [Synechococcus sp. CCY 9618]|uniref:hypothetical protein n=1 Tax=Synechococcus sp. CCY 9618 TaxID=2815602 RepID=UPI001C2136E7|nr:hypothetical protein [Synechococcus sp. CCY 9618]
MVTLSDAVGDRGSRKHLLALAAGLAMGLVGCSTGPRETAIQNAKAGDLLVEAGGSRVELVRAFQTGAANGQYKGVVKVSTANDPANVQLHEMSAICSIRGEPGWPTYDNLYGNPINNPNAESKFSAEDRWQRLFHFDGRTEKIGKLDSDGWTARLKDNLCRKGDFDDTGIAPRPAT